jgi:hypothetical protein
MQGTVYLGEMSMKRMTISALAAVGCMLVSMAPVYADAGSPGITGGLVAEACFG